MFSSLFGGPGGAAGSPSAFMSPPGMTPQQWAMLLAMQNQQNGQGASAAANGAPQLPNPALAMRGAGGMPPPGAGMGVGGPNQNVLDQLRQILQMRALLGGMGASGMSPMGASQAATPQALSG